MRPAYLVARRQVIYFPLTPENAPAPVVLSVQCGLDPGPGGVSVDPNYWSVNNEAHDSIVNARKLIEHAIERNKTPYRLAAFEIWQLHDNAARRTLRMLSAIGTLGMVFVTAGALLWASVPLDPFVLPVGGVTSRLVPAAIFLCALVGSIAWTHLPGPSVFTPGGWAPFNNYLNEHVARFSLGDRRPGRNAMTGPSGGLAFACALASALARVQPFAFGWQRVLLDSRRRFIASAMIEGNSLKSVGRIKQKIEAIKQHNSVHPDQRLTHLIFSAADEREVIAAWYGKQDVDTPERCLRRGCRLIVSGTVTLMFCDTFEGLCRALENQFYVRRPRTWGVMLVICFTAAGLCPPPTAPLLSGRCAPGSSKATSALHVIVQSSRSEPVACELRIDDAGYLGPLEAAFTTYGLDAVSQARVFVAEGEIQASQGARTGDRQITLIFTPAARAAVGESSIEVTVTNRGGRSSSYAFVFVRPAA